MRQKVYVLYELIRRWNQKNQDLLIGKMAGIKKDTEQRGSASSDGEKEEIELQRQFNTKEEG